MKNILIIVLLLCISMLYCQKYSFVPKKLKAINSTELIKKGPAKNLDLVYFSDRTKTLLSMVMPKVIDDEFQLRMFANDNKKYKSLFVTKRNNDKAKINYKGIPDLDVGKLTNKELEFLKSKNVTIFSSENGHSSWTEKP